MRKTRKWTTSEIDFIQKNLEKFGAIICAEKLDRSVNSVIQKGFRLKIGTNPHPTNATEAEIKELKYIGDFDTHLDFTIDFSLTKNPKELAYFLGFFWADGYISKKGHLVIEIVEDDAKQIFPIFQKLGTFHLYKRERVGRRPQASIGINNVDIANKLRELGKYPKSIESHEKIFNYVPKIYWPYFIRGLIDGDGSYTITVRPNTIHVIFSIAGSHDQDWSYIQNVLLQYGLPTMAVRRIESNGKSSYIRNSSLKSLKTFVSNIYKTTDDIWLPRKYQKVQLITKL